MDFVDGDWRRGVVPAALEARLVEDRAHAIQAVIVVHNETSTGATSRVAEVEKGNVDITVSCSQKGLMLPPALASRRS
ncbi:aspartate aminotransferase-like enzyme [Rhizobium sp. BK313]|uniref:hypothetical protein n=1 Tax=Rhizobium sp. BK313 TaxID=2587081 RepID=UPI0017938FE7|nr:aspartate aminotransferase-like enzyme [Rhizobium sp. BK313]